MAKPDHKPDPSYELNYDTADPNYEEGAQVEYIEDGDTEFDEVAQPDYNADFSDSNAQEAS